MVADVSNDQLVAITSILVAIITVGGTIFAAWMTVTLSRVHSQQSAIHDKIDTANGHTIGQYIEGIAEEQGIVATNLKEDKDLARGAANQHTLDHEDKVPYDE